ncbi:hypothetical protein F4805DRAFT_470994 [Annulohypoxylon moriforme]|nr:hypothetical protein F4805DRAFT_470994 [Annulohypoxylon moriforme]
MATLAPICRGCSRPIILFRSPFQSIKPYNQTTRAPQWLQPNCTRIISRRSFAMKVLPPDKKTIGKIPPKSVKLQSKQASAETASRPAKPTVVPPSVKNTEIPPRVSFAETLANNPTPTTLYETAPQKMFLFSSYLAGFSCILGAAVNIVVNVYNIPEGMHWLVPVAFGTVGMAMAGIGAMFILVPSGAVRSIKVLPTQSTKSPKPAAKATSPSDGQVRLEIIARRSVPFMYQRLVVDPKDVVMAAPLYNVITHEVPDDSLLPRDGMFKNFRRGITGEGFAPIKINDVKYKLDITAADVLDEGRALDRIVRVETSPIVERLLAQKRGA